MNETLFEQAVAILTVVVGILVKVIGFPDQIIKNHHRRSTEGLATPMIIISVFD
ncbi:PQ-loop repeat-containing protein [Desulfospira joergensenii]|uniref:PQ-loop repeat-containing protein n=1 Tax=Desulfospira joergensenii TaxID=53329 RepID=UPI0003B3D472|nr:PQ-loop repeat-containing protein [Desulfospira joergensenii]